MHFSPQGMANYFAVNASYSDRYAYSRGERRCSWSKFLQETVIYQCASESSLHMPPTKEGTGATGKLQFARVGYDTVTI